MQHQPEACASDLDDGSHITCLLSGLLFCVLMLMSVMTLTQCVVMCLQKLHVYLFDEVFVMTRCCSHIDATSYQVYRQPIALADLTVRDHADALPSRKGSFRNAFSQLQTGTLFITILYCIE